MVLVTYQRVVSGEAGIIEKMCLMNFEEFIKPTTTKTPMSEKTIQNSEKKINFCEGEQEKIVQSSENSSNKLDSTNQSSHSSEQLCAESGNAFVKFIQAEAFSKRVFEGTSFAITAKARKDRHDKNPKIVGIIEMRDYCHLNMIFVDKEYHNQGISKQLFEIALEICKQKNKQLSEITSSVTPNAVEVFKKLGFLHEKELQKQLMKQYGESQKSRKNSMQLMNTSFDRELMKNSKLEKVEEDYAAEDFENEEDQYFKNSNGMVYCTMKYPVKIRNIQNLRC